MRLIPPGLLLALLTGCTSFENNQMDLSVVLGIIAFSLCVPLLALIYVFWRHRRRRHEALPPDEQP